MKQLNFSGWVLVAILALPAGVFAQSLAPQVVASGGGSGTVAGVSLDFTVGELVTTTATSGSTTLTQGFQQPPVIETVGRNDAAPAAGQLVLYPNPSAGNTFLRVEAQQRACYTSSFTMPWASRFTPTAHS